LQELGEQVRRRVPTHRNSLIVYGDATSESQTAQTGQTDYQILGGALKGLGYPFRFDILTKNPPERNRINTVNYFLGGRNTPVRLEVAERCAWLIDDLEQVLWKPDGSGIRKSHDANDPYYKRTHISDALGYMLWAREPQAVGMLGNIAAQKRRVIHVPQASYV
jgi:hypothetical protein